jgi:hypothetical protein
MIYLRQNTADQEIPLGYFLDSSDGDTEEIGLTIANTDIKLWKFGATTLANKNSGGATHISNGIYYAVLDATDTNTLGSMIVFVHVSGALTIKVDCLILAANVYDSLIAGSDNLQVDTIQVDAIKVVTDKLDDTLEDDAGTYRFTTNALEQAPGGDKTGYELSAAGIDAILDEEVEGTYTLRQLLRIFASALAGKLSGAATTTITIRDINDTKDRIVATVDSDENRIAVTLDGD